MTMAGAMIGWAGPQATYLLLAALLLGSPAWPGECDCLLGYAEVITYAEVIDRLAPKPASRLPWSATCTTNVDERSTTTERADAARTRHRMWSICGLAASDHTCGRSQKTASDLHFHLGRVGEI